MFLVGLRLMWVLLVGFGFVLSRWFWDVWLLLLVWGVGLGGFDLVVWVCLLGCFWLFAGFWF